MQARQEIERRLQEKEEEFENTRKNFARAMDSMQASLEGESKAKQEALRQVHGQTEHNPLARWTLHAKMSALILDKLSYRPSYRWWPISWVTWVGLTFLLLFLVLSGLIGNW